MDLRLIIFIQTTSNDNTLVSNGFSLPLEATTDGYQKIGIYIIKTLIKLV